MTRHPMLALAATLVAASLSAAAPGHETVRPVYSQTIPNLPGKTLTSVVVSYPPGARSPSHRHAASAFIYAFVLQGDIRSQVDDAPARTYHAGESFTEAPGARHRVSENASRTRPARLLALFIANTGDAPLTTPDQPKGIRP